MRENVGKGYTYMREDVERLWFERAVGIRATKVRGDHERRALEQRA